MATIMISIAGTIPQYVYTTELPLLNVTTVPAPVPQCVFSFLDFLPLKIFIQTYFPPHALHSNRLNMVYLMMSKPFNHLMQLLVQESFIEFSRHETFRLYNATDCKYF